jgi:hypothetical protein
MNSQSKQTWLILSHAFNMDGRAASQTITDKVPHLLNLGVKPIVVSGVLGDKDAVIEHHQVFPALPVGLRFDLRHYFRKKLKNKLLYRLTMFAVSLALLPFYLLEKLLFPIETSWSWAISAYLSGAKVIKNARPALVYSTGGAYAAHIAGYWLSKRFGIPWIAEIHDPMVIESKLNKTYRERFMARLETLICTHADVVWWFTEMAMGRAKKRNPQLGNRGHFVPAGVDKPNIERVPYQRGEQLIIGHFGSLSPTRNLGIFLEALERFASCAPLRVASTRLQIYGGSMDDISAEAIRHFAYPEMIMDMGRLETDPVTGQSGRDRVLHRMNATDCLLMLHGTIPFCEEYIPSKLYEYLWAKRPILGLVHRNPQLHNILAEFGHWSVDAENAEAIVQALEEIYAKWETDDLTDIQEDPSYTTEQAVRPIYSWVPGNRNNMQDRP